VVASFHREYIAQKVQLPRKKFEYDFLNFWLKKQTVFFSLKKKLYSISEFLVRCFFFLFNSEETKQNTSLLLLYPKQMLSIPAYHHNHPDYKARI
jgi:hypothetical protein